jgi:hypothetical protein
VEEAGQLVLVFSIDDRVYNHRGNRRTWGRALPRGNHWGQKLFGANFPMSFIQNFSSKASLFCFVLLVALGV